MDSPIKIVAEPLQYDRNSCRFRVDAPVLPKAFARFTAKEKAQGASPLAERLYALDGVTGVMIQESDVTVTGAPPVDWRAIGPRIGAAIRAHLASGQPAVNADYFKDAPAQDVLREKIQRILDEQINPAIASHGGTISLIDVQGTRVFIQMGGGCQGCGSATATLREGVETALRDQVPEIGEILDVTDHAAGTNPYYAAH
jgi:NFU1 iron-sulfur cluster scaffold homolog, mitochondrial